MVIRASELDPKRGWAADTYIMTDEERREEMLAPLREADQDATADRHRRAADRRRAVHAMADGMGETAMRGETFKGSVECVRRQAPEAFAQHVLTVRRPWVWKVSRPDSWTYGFYVLMAPGALLVYGDLGEATFRMHAGHEREVFEWAMRCIPHDRSYVLSKISNREAFRQFYPGDAVAYAKECVKEKPTRKNREFLEDVQQADEHGDLSSAAFYNAAHENEQYDVPSCEDWGARAIWMHLALETFVRLTPAMPEGDV
jgi:hypothetical protein